jgi:hypothetical protein
LQQNVVGESLLELNLTKFISISQKIALKTAVRGAGEKKDLISFMKELS